ncbi:MAG: hypothetical protein COA79_20140 [Planctomycetota bacterium]|nr:MAG: hypothetical protein COA79_20140 [Planctomycetota bacterium]
MKNKLTNISSISSAIRSFNLPSVVSSDESKKINEYDGFRIEIANTIPQLMDAANLAYRGYLKKGFVSKSELPFVFKEWDVSGISVCLVAYDDEHNCVGTMTIVPDFENLPVDVTFSDELNDLRSKGHNLCEFTRFIIDENFRNQKCLLTALMEWSPLVVEFYFHGTDIIVEVNPRHKGFYTKKLLFKTETGIKNCPLVNDAPAVLLRLSVNNFKEQRSNLPDDATCKRLVYSAFISKDKSKLDNMIKYVLKHANKIQPQLSLLNYLAPTFKSKVS